MAHGHFGGMQVACLLWQRVCSEKFPSRTSLSGGFGKEAFLCVPLLLGSKRAVSPKCGHEPIYVSVSFIVSSSLNRGLALFQGHFSLFACRLSTTRLSPRGT